MPQPTVLITGGTSGIGRATAELLARRDHQVVVTGRNAENVAAAARELASSVTVLEADAGSLADNTRVIASVEERFGHLDALFLNAGISRPQPIEQVGEGDFDELLATNFRGQFFLLQRALPLVRDGGSIAVTIGTGVTRGLPGQTVTSATRGALLGLVPSLAKELAPRRIRVNAVSPGAIDTPIWDKLGVPAEAREATAATIPLGRFGTATEVAELVAFLLSDRATYITGQHIEVAGGL